MHVYALEAMIWIVFLQTRKLCSICRARLINVTVTMILLPGYNLEYGQTFLLKSQMCTAGILINRLVTDVTFNSAQLSQGVRYALTL